MTDSPAIDFETAFAELNKLNYLITNHTSLSTPRLNPAEFLFIYDDGSIVVVQGIRTGLYYGTSRIRTTETNGHTYRYLPYVRVRPEERTITDWVKV